MNNLDSKIKLSIITVNLNNKEGLQKTINSIINQTCKDFEWIIIDGGSIDGSKELIEKYSDHVNYWISEHDKGIYNAMNKGILASHGEYLLFLNSGDYIYDESTIKIILPHLKEYDFIIGDIYVNRWKYSIHKEGLLDINETLFLASIPHPSTFIKDSIFRNYGYYEEKYKIISDWVLFINTLILSDATYKLLTIPISVFNTNGISSRNSVLVDAERNNFLNTIPRVKDLITFYLEYKEINNLFMNHPYIYNLLRKLNKYLKRFNQLRH